MQFIKTSRLSKSQEQEICDLWNNEYPEKLNYRNVADFTIYLEKLTGQSHIIMVDEDQHIKGWYFDFLRENEKWFAIILDSDCQGKGFGRKILNLAKEKESELNGWVIDHSNDKKKNGDRYESPLSFYLKNGFELLKQSRLEDERISAVKVKWEKTTS